MRAPREEGAGTGPAGPLLQDTHFSFPVSYHRGQGCNKHLLIYTSNYTTGVLFLHEFPRWPCKVKSRLCFLIPRAALSLLSHKAVTSSQFYQPGQRAASSTRPCQGQTWSSSNLPHLDGWEVVTHDPFFALPGLRLSEHHLLLSLEDLIPRPLRPVQSVRVLGFLC